MEMPKKLTVSMLRVTVMMLREGWRQLLPDWTGTMEMPRKLTVSVLRVTVMMLRDGWRR